MKLIKFTQTLVIILVFISILGISAVPNITEAFAQINQYSEYDANGFFFGIWHGLLAPYSLIARWFLDDVVMYAIPNTGWFYDIAFLIGVTGSIPIGWVAAIISIIWHIL